MAHAQIPEGAALMDLRLDYNFVPASKKAYVVAPGHMINLAQLTNATIGDTYLQYFDADGRILLVPIKPPKEE